MATSVEQAKKHYYETHSVEARAALTAALEAEATESVKASDVEEVEEVESEDLEVEHGSLNPAVLYQSPDQE